tara:strand:- start:41 stop:862 length:822 start_codon:yes stop_codon:yes gene_type:complete
MILTLIKKNNIIISELINLLPNSNIYIDQKYNNFTHIISDDKDIINILYISEYINIINNYIYNIITNEIKYFNKNIINKKYEVINLINQIITEINNNIIIDDVCTYIKNSNFNEFLNVLYLLFILKNKSQCIIDAIKLKVNNNNVYLRHKHIYNYDMLLSNKHKIQNNIGLTPDIINTQQYINNTYDFTKLDKNNIDAIHMNELNGNKYINSFINNFFNEKQLTEKGYNNIGKLIDYGKSNEIKLYNNYARRKAYNKGKSENTEISVFELFQL